MVVFQTKSAKLLDAIVNNPSVRGTAEAGAHRVCTASVVENSNNICIAAAHGAALFVQTRQDEYEGHIYCLAGQRGSKALELGQLALSRLFKQHGARLLTAAVPLVLPQARFLCRRLGMSSVKRSDSEEFFMLESETWAEF